MEDLTGQAPQAAEPPASSEARGTDEAVEALAAARRQRRIFFLSFGTILFMGLALGLLYLSGRVMETRAAGTPVPTQPATGAQVAAKPAAIAETKAEPTHPQKSVSDTKPAPAPKPQVVADAKMPPAAKPAASLETKPAVAPKPQLVADGKPAPSPKPAASPGARTATVSNPQLVADAKTAPALKPAPAKTDAVKPAQQTSASSARPSREESIIDGSLPRSPKPYDGPMLKPHPGDTYVQVGAYSPNYTPSFLTVLEKKGFHGVVASGPNQDVYRVLIGPFADHNAMRNAFAQIQKAGISDAFDRIY